MLSKTPEERKLGHGNQRPKIKLVRAFMPVLITSNFEDDSIKNDCSSMETPFFHSNEISIIQSTFAFTCNAVDIEGSCVV